MPTCSAAVGASKACSDDSNRFSTALRTLGHPRAALLGFATAVLAYTVLSLLKRCIEQAHREQAPELHVSIYHLAVDVVSDYKGMLIALPPSAWSSWSEDSPERMVDYFLHLARFVSPRSVATSKRGPKKPKPKGYVEAAAVRKHFSIARVLRGVKGATPSKGCVFVPINPSHLPVGALF